MVAWKKTFYAVWIAQDVAIVSTARTGLAKSWRGALNNTHGATMAGHVIAHAVRRAGIEPGAVEDVIMGCANPEGATGWDIARQAAIRAGLPVSVSGMTVNRFCSSGLQTIALAAQRIQTGEGDTYVAGGVESISLVQNQMNQHLSQPLDAESIRQGTYVSFITDFYTRNNSAMIWWVWGNALVFLGLMIASAILFFLAGSTRYQILYATLFLTGVQVIVLTKIVYFLVVIRNRTLRDLKRLELCVAEGNEVRKARQPKGEG